MVRDDVVDLLTNGPPECTNSSAILLIRYITQVCFQQQADEFLDFRVQVYAGFDELIELIEIPGHNAIDEIKDFLDNDKVRNTMVSSLLAQVNADQFMLVLTVLPGLVG